ncbi:uncharacterized protein G2W53_040951 [Senna tora]|uniref:Uncharacterized protein n=1 Tax=Senna tora TaxID=362788 RepID=A0A834SG96_9FABA|nr:uncharacterized protein G2W53_040951 [Senna tora]
MSNTAKRTLCSTFFCELPKQKGNLMVPVIWISSSVKLIKLWLAGKTTVGATDIPLTRKTARNQRTKENGEEMDSSREDSGAYEPLIKITVHIVRLFERAPSLEVVRATKKGPGVGYAVISISHAVRPSLLER